jgi:carboxylesterase 2
LLIVVKKMVASKSFLLGAILQSVKVAAGSLWQQTIPTEYGLVRGYPAFNQTDIPVTAWKGLPFAATTGGENRWRAPQRRERWNGTLSAHDFGYACPDSQQEYAVDEDCLSVNVWSNANSMDAGLPVFIWVYGGECTSAQPLFDGGGLAQKDVVVVTINYRANAFAWLAHPELAEESAHNVSGNYGLLDQIEALKWVNRNIANFGGDPNRVTVAGQSGGSAAVYHLVNSPLTKGLIHGAIAESGVRYPYDTLIAGLATSYRTMDDALNIGINYTLNHNVSTISELRKLPMEDLLDPRDFESINWITALDTGEPPKFRPTLDGWAFPATYLELLKSGTANDVPFITGNNKDESGASTTTNYTVKEYNYISQFKYANLSSRFFDLYPANNDTDADRSWNAAARDTSRVSSYLFAQEWAKAYESPFYTYYWDHAPPGQSQGAYHMSEINYIFNNLYATDLPWTTADWLIADVMSSYWANFVKTGNPNNGSSFTGPGGLVHWPANQHNNDTMHLGYRQGVCPIASSEQVSLITDFFLGQQHW